MSEIHYAIINKIFISLKSEFHGCWTLFWYVMFLSWLLILSKDSCCFRVFHFLSFQMLDYEQMPNVHLGIGVKNQADFHPSVASQFQMHSTPVRIQVINVKEGPKFDPNSMTFRVREGVRGDSLMNYILGTYTAVDLDTGNPATNVRYYKPVAHIWVIKHGSAQC